MGSETSNAPHFNYANLTQLQHFRQTTKPLSNLGRLRSIRGFLPEWWGRTSTHHRSNATASRRTLHLLLHFLLQRHSPPNRLREHPSIQRGWSELGHFWFLSRGGCGNDKELWRSKHRSNLPEVLEVQPNRPRWNDNATNCTVHSKSLIQYRPMIGQDYMSKNQRKALKAANKARKAYLIARCYKTPFRYTGIAPFFIQG